MPPIVHWRPLSPLGFGSFGHVSLALNLHDSSLFAAKSAPLTSSSSVALLSLQNELRILYSLHSPFIVRCLGADFSPSHNSSPPVLRNIFLEYMDGGSLADLLKRSGGKLHDERLVRQYTRAILQGLDYLHQNGIAHCDIKSHNILIGSSGVKLADFGAARRMDEPMDSDRSTVRGTPLWMAPEAMQGMEQGSASDIWSLGCTVVEMLQGRPPWAHLSNLAALFLRAGSSQENPPLPESISAQARDFLLQCLHKDPKARPTAAELLKHPFLCRNIQPAEAKAADNMYDQPSPRSTMNFVQSDGDSDWEEESTIPISAGGFPALRPTQAGSMPAAIHVSTAPQAPPVSGDLGASGDWMTVRRTERRRGEDRPLRPAPFKQAAGAGLLRARKGCDVSLEGAAFLRSKRSRTRVG